MSLRATFGLNHDFPRLVQQLRFKFITNKPKIQIDWNLIGCVNIQELIANTEVYILEKHINDIIYYSLQEEEIRILDPKFVKLFRLTQLTLEYILFCLHYVDRGFVQLQNKLSEQEKKYEEICQELENKEKLLQKYKKKITDSQSIYHYGVQNNLANGEIFQCEICKKIFINDDYLNLHKAKRQHYSEYQPGTDHQQPSVGQEVKNNDNETNKLFLEIKQLKERINTTEQMLKNDKLIQNERKSTLIDHIDVQTSLESHVTPNYSDSCVQCDLITEKVRNSENEIELLRREIREWQEIQSNHILNQLETIKEKINSDFSKLIEESQRGKATVADNYEILNSVQHDNIVTLEKKLDHKLESNVERLKNDLALQEQKWRAKLAKLEMKSDLISELHVQKSPRKLLTKQHSFSITHNAPVTVITHHDSSDSNSEDQSNRSEEKQRKNSLPIIPIDDQILNQNSNSQKTILKSQMVDINKNSSKNNSKNKTHVTPTKKVLESTVVKNDQILETSYLNDETDMKQNKNVTFQNDDTVKIIFTNADHSNEISSVSQSEQLIKNHPYHNNQENSNPNTENICRQPSQSTLGKRSITSLKDAVLSNPNFLSEFRETMLDLLDSSLKELGVNPEWTSIPRETLENHFRTLQHTQKYIAKIHPNYYEIRSNILDQVDKISSEQLLETTPTKKHSNKSKGDHIHKKRRTVPPAVCMDTLRPLNKITDTYLSSPSLIISPIHMKCNDDVKLNMHSKSNSTLQQTTRSLDRKVRSKNVSESSDLETINRNSPLANRSFKRTKSSQALFSSVLKIKDKVMAAMKSSNLNNKSNKLQTNEKDAKTEHKPNISEQQSDKREGLYKLTVFNKNNSPTSSKILSVTPVTRRDFVNTQKNTKNTSPTHFSADISSTSSSSDDNIQQKVNTIQIESARPIKPSSSNSSLSSASVNEQQQIVVKPVETVNINAMKYNETEEAEIVNNAPTVVKKKVIFNLSKFSDRNSESKSSDSKIKSSTNERRDSSISFDRNSKRDEFPENLLKSFMVSRKYEESTNKTPPRQQLMYNGGSGDSTSISSSVFDGSIKNTTAVTLNDNKQIIDQKNDLTKNTDDLLVDISDFDFSSD